MEPTREIYGRRLLVRQIKVLFFPYISCYAGVVFLFIV